MIAINCQKFQISIIVMKTTNTMMKCVPVIDFYHFPQFYVIISCESKNHEENRKFFCFKYQQYRIYFQKISMRETFGVPLLTELLCVYTKKTPLYNQYILRFTQNHNLSKRNIFLGNYLLIY